MLVVAEFTYPGDADAAIHWGVTWRGTQYNCQRFNTKTSVLQCHKCQMLGHKVAECSGRNRCSTCAEHHASKVCRWPKHVKCALCNNVLHSARSAKCPKKRESFAKAEQEHPHAQTYTSTPREELTTTGQVKRGRHQPTYKSPSQTTGPRIKTFMLRSQLILRRYLPRYELRVRLSIDVGLPRSRARSRRVALAEQW